MYPEKAGYKKTGTSQKAANTTDAEKLRQKVYQALLVKNMTSDEIATHLGIDRLSIRPRCSELLKTNKIKDTGVSRPNISGKDAAVWAAVVSPPAQGFLFCTSKDGSSL